MSQILAFLPVAVLVIVTPGPDTAVTVRSALAGGRRAGILTGLGVVTGQACWTLAASAGITALLVASEPAFVAVKLAGAAYLAWLGVQALWSAFRGHAAAGPRPRHVSAFRQGLLSDLGNPKMAAFFTSLLPQFALGGEPTFFGMLALGLLFSALTFAWLALYATAVDKVMRRSTLRRVLDAITGAVLIALGLRLATESR